MRRNKITLLLISVSFLSQSCFKTAQEMQNNNPETGQSEIEKAKTDSYLKANISADIDSLKEKNARLEGRVGQLEQQLKETEEKNTSLSNRLTSMEENFLQFKEDHQSSIASLTADIKLLDDRTRKGSSQTLEGKKSSEPSLSGEQAATKARSWIKKKWYSKTVDLLTGTLKQNIRNRSELLYLRGEALYKNKKYEDALLSYNEVVEKHRKSRQWSSSVKMVAQCFENMGMKAEASSYRALLKANPKKK